MLPTQSPEVFVRSDEGVSTEKPGFLQDDFRIVLKCIQCEYLLYLSYFCTWRRPERHSKFLIGMDFGLSMNRTKNGYIQAKCTGVRSFLITPPPIHSSAWSMDCPFPGFLPSGSLWICQKEIPSGYILLVTGYLLWPVACISRRPTVGEILQVVDM
jgi:hypothetical protein